MATQHILVTGKVQGVFFRASAKKIALALGLTGWVKNTNTGDVEIVVSGSEDELSKFEEWCRTGPPQAKVRELIIRHEAEAQFHDFKIIK